MKRKRRNMRKRNRRTKVKQLEGCEKKQKQTVLVDAAATNSSSSSSSSSCSSSMLTRKVLGLAVPEVVQRYWVLLALT